MLPVRKLAEQLIVNPNTVARAYRELESEGVVQSRRGSGVFISEGVSPLAKREQNKVLNERIDVLLAALTTNPTLPGGLGWSGAGNEWTANGSNSTRQVSGLCMRFAMR